MQLQPLLAQLDASAQLDIGADIQLLAGWLARFGLPAPAWEPDEAWLELALPTLALDARAMTTISAFAQLRADVLAQFSIDLLVPGQATPFIRLAATLQARLSALAGAGAGLGIDVGGWTGLSATLSAVAQVDAALSLGLLPSPPPGPPLSVWRPFLIQIKALLPVIAVSAQLGLDLSADISAQLSAMLRVMLRISLPAFSAPDLQLMASLTAALSAVAQLRAALGVDPLAIGLPETQLLVTARVDATTAAIQSSLGLSLPSLLALLGSLPRLDSAAGLIAPAAVVDAAAAIDADALAALDWQVPDAASLPVVSVGLPVAAFAAQLSAATDFSVATSPCAGCDAASLLAGVSSR